jgi:chemotaxis protein methyltransferase CheR
MTAETIDRIDDHELDALLETIFERYHYDFRSYARASLRRRSARAMETLGARSIVQLRELVATDATAFGRLLPWFTVQLSDLFRDPSYFRTFREQIVPMLRTYPSRKLWVAGCSTGEEAYSFAIILQEEGLLERTQIYATDIYADSLRVAQAGVYDLDRMRQFSENHQKTGATCSLSELYTTSAHGAAVFDRSLRERIVFADHSLATDNVFAEMHVVSCRNVLIYYDKVLQNRAVKLFHDSLVRHGYLGLGPKESLEFTDLYGAFDAMPERWYRKRDLR